MQRTTNKMIEYQLKELVERTGLSLESNNNPVYGGYVLDEVDSENRPSDISYYRMGKQDFYIMLRAMNRLLEKVEQKKKQEQEVTV